MYTANSFCSICHFNCYSIVLIWNFIVEDLGGEKNKVLYTESIINKYPTWGEGGATVVEKLSFAELHARGEKNQF